MISERTNKKKVNIYKLIDPDTKKVRYIGATVRTLKERLYQHKHDALKNKGTHKIHWLKKLYAEQKTPIITLIEVCNIENYRDRENFWINYYGFNNLTNTRKESAGIIVDRTKSSKRRSAEAHCKPIIQLSSKGEFIAEYPSVKQASESTGISKTALGNCLHGRCKLTGGYRWIEKEKYDKGHVLSPLKFNFIRGKNNPKSIPVKIYFKDGSFKQFDTIADAAKYLDTSARYIGCIINSNCKAYGNVPKKHTNIKSIIRL